MVLWEKDWMEDAIRFYRLGNSYHNKIDSMGKKLKVEAGEPLLF